MNLEQETAKLLAWLKEYALPGFSEKAKDTYTSDHKIVYDELEVIATHLKHAAKIGNTDFFHRQVKEYKTLFGQVNELLAKQIYADAIDHYLDEGMSNEDARSRATDHVWANKAVAHWLPLSVKLTGPQGQEVFLVANERHIPPGKTYVMTYELESLKNSGRNPWDVVAHRRAHVS